MEDLGNAVVLHKDNQVLVDEFEKVNPWILKHLPNVWRMFEMKE
jgi:hypothetical protein